MSSPSAGSVVTNCVLKKHGNAFSTIIPVVPIVTNVANINEIDFCGSFGISFFSSSKNTFSPLFTLVVVVYVNVNIAKKLTTAAIPLYFMFCQNIEI